MEPAFSEIEVDKNGRRNEWIKNGGEERPAKAYKNIQNRDFIYFFPGMVYSIYTMLLIRVSAGDI